MTRFFGNSEALAQRAWDELCIMKTLSRLAHAQDNLDRQAYKNCFTESVLLTDSVMFENWEPQEISVDELVDNYFAGLRKYDAGHHIVVNHIIEVTGDDATCTADLYGVAVLFEDGESRTTTLGGRYFLRLRRHGDDWRIYERSVKVRYRGSGDSEFRERVAARADAQAPVDRP